MTIIEDNFFFNLHRLATSQDENFITESLAFLLRYMITNELEAGKSLLSSITCNRLNVSLHELVTVDVKTQVSTEEGKPDVVISTDDHLIFLEVKVDSSFGHRQLERYRNQLQKSGYLNTSLLVLTRYSFDQNIHSIIPDFCFRWHNLIDWLTNLKLNDNISNFFCKQFIEFLTMRGIAMGKVGWELVEGVKHAQALIDMIYEALIAKGITVRSSAAWNWKGFYIEEKKFFIGMYYSHPNMFRFNTEIVLSIVPDNVTLGIIEGGRWQNDLDLTSEEVHFFARSKASQIQRLERFIEESLNYGKQLVN